MWLSRQLSLRPRARGFHLVTDEIVQQLPELTSLRVGLVQLHLLHTSASLTLNENCDPDVRHDLAGFLTRLVPESASYYRHVLEGADDMPAHILASLLGVSVMLPISEGRLALGTWQGIWLGEHRLAGGARRLQVTVQGELR
ncbi:secondary thiamine-phosphate synthase enzyme YjbQ [Pseudaeromonas paramecii]|uniref:Secondary thiamine-phosphate synthase enzyme YjbQ n=1 Tax=Pseudaeromonas paramecii TaxID=2138166 RepID=A0ABP8Q9D1_9GAMM